MEAHCDRCDSSLKNWRYTNKVADIDEKNIEYARDNVKSNSLQDRIKIYASTSSGPLIPLDKLRIHQYVRRHVSTSSILNLWKGSTLS